MPCNTETHLTCCITAQRANAACCDKVLLCYTEPNTLWSPEITGPRNYTQQSSEDLRVRQFDGKIRIANFCCKLLIMKINKANGIHTVLGKLGTVFKGRSNLTTKLLFLFHFGTIKSLFFINKIVLCLVCITPYFNWATTLNGNLL